MDGAEHFQDQINYGHVVALNKIIISLLASSHLLKFQYLCYLLTFEGIIVINL